MWTGMTPTPNPGFVKRLKEFDSKLDCVFSRKFGKFVIRQPSRVSGMVPAIIVDGGPGDGYRQPHVGDIKELYTGDFTRKSAKERILEGEEYMKDYREKEQAHVDDEIRNMTKDDKIQLMRAHRQHILKDGKANSEFRRVTPKSKGQVFKSLK